MSNNEQNTTPVCLASVKELVDELEKRFQSGAVVLMNHSKMPADIQKRWDDYYIETGKLESPEMYQARRRNWGRRHDLIALHARNMMVLHEELDDDENDLDDWQL